MNQLGVTHHSKAMMSTWLFHHPSRLLFDAGDGVTVALAERAFGIEHLCISHACNDHVGGIASLVGLRAHGMGTKDKPLHITYPRDNHRIDLLRRYIETLHPKLPFELTWTPLDPGFAFQLTPTIHVATFPMVHQRNATTLGYKLVERRKRLKPQYVGQDIGALVKSGAVDKRDLSETYEAITFAYCLDCVGLDPAHIKGVENIFIDSTFLKPADRGDKTHFTKEEALEVCKEAGAKHVYLSHVSGRYSIQHQLDEQKRLDDNVTLVLNDRVHLL